MTELEHAQNSGTSLTPAGVWLLADGRPREDHEQCCRPFFRDSRHSLTSDSTFLWRVASPLLCSFKEIVAGENGCSPSISGTPDGDEPKDMKSEKNRIIHLRQHNIIQQIFSQRLGVMCHPYQGCVSMLSPLQCLGQPKSIWKKRPTQAKLLEVGVAKIPPQWTAGSRSIERPLMYYSIVCSASCRYLILCLLSGETSYRALDIVRSTQRGLGRRQ